MMWQEQLSFTNQETGIAQQMSSEQSTALQSWATERGEKESTTNKMRSSGTVEKKNWCLKQKDSVSVPNNCKKLKALHSTAMTAAVKLPQQLIHKILAGIRTTVRESIQPQKGNLVLLLKRLKRTKNRKRIRTWNHILSYNQPIFLRMAICLYTI